MEINYNLLLKAIRLLIFLTTGWAGVSFYTGGSNGDEEIYIGSLGNTPSWGIDGPAMGGPTQINWPSAVAEVKFTYDYDSGDWTLKIGNQTANGNINSNLELSTVRIAADISNYADIAVSNLNVVVNNGTDIQALSTCPPYTWINTNSYNNNTFIQVHTLPGAAMGGADSIVTLDLSFATTFPFGEGTPSNPYQIASKSDLKILSENSCFWDKHFIQTADIEFISDDFQSGGDFDNGGAGFLPIGNFTNQFFGTYNGNEHKIMNLFINSADQNVGLFEYSGTSSSRFSTWF
ncbi:MAG: hypothetical protein IPG89_06695 [Bacteroidetes bacterium]|nr:hypothetical protein [Bacteroidota bacterium]